MTAKKIKLFNDDKKIAANISEDEFRSMSNDDKKKLVLELFKDLGDEDKKNALKIIRLQSVLIVSNIFDDYCENVSCYHDDIAAYIEAHVPEKSFIKQLDLIDTFADKNEYTRKLMELDINIAMYMSDHLTEVDGEPNYDPLVFSTYQFAYAHWIEERNDYMDFFLTAFENDADKAAILDIIKNNNSHDIADKIACYISEHLDTIEFSDNMGTPDYMGAPEKEVL